MQSGHKHRKSTSTSTSLPQVEDIQIINLSAKILSDSQMSLLSHGLSFSPTTHFDLLNAILDVNRYARSITIRNHFLKMNENVNTQTANEISMLSSSPAPIAPYDYSSISATIDSFNFQELLAVAQLQSLVAENADISNDSVSRDFFVKN